MIPFITAEAMVALLDLDRKPTFGILFRWQSFWIGLHYSEYCKRYSLNLLPCVTIWWTVRGGQPPRKTL